MWVQANVIAPDGTEQTTNNFYFTWCRDEGEPLDRMVVPRTYQGEFISCSLVGVLLTWCMLRQRQCNGSREGGHWLSEPKFVDYVKPICEVDFAIVDLQR